MGPHFLQSFNEKQEVGLENKRMSGKERKKSKYASLLGEAFIFIHYST